MRTLISLLLAVLTATGIYFLWRNQSNPEDASAQKNETHLGKVADNTSLAESSSANGESKKSEDVFRTSNTLDDALRILLPRVKSGDYDALRAFSMIMKECEVLQEGGRATYDEFLEDKAALRDPRRQALISRKLLFCQTGGSLLAEAQKIFADYDAYEINAIKHGDPEAIVMGNVMRAAMTTIAPEYASQEAVNDALARVDETGSSSSKMRVALARLLSPKLIDAEVLAIDETARLHGESDLQSIKIAASQLYGCKVGTYCGVGADIQWGGCLINGVCKDVPVETYIRNYQFNSAQVALIDRYLSYLEARQGGTKNK